MSPRIGAGVRHNDIQARMRLFGLLFLLAGVASGGEYAVLSSGARLHVDRHEADGAKVRLYYGTGIVEMDSSLVRGYEAEEYPPPVPAVPPPVPVAAEGSAGNAVLVTHSPQELADA